jgi:ethanolamine ammonia-lyase small subunit
MSLTAARQSVADAASTVPGVTVRPWPTVKNPKTGDGWVAVQRITPARFATNNVTLAVIVCLGADSAKAEELLDEFGPAVLDAVTRAIPCAAVAVEPAILPADVAGTPVHALVLTATTED